jgi:GTP-binding protein
MGQNRTGARGADAVVRLPTGTQIFSEDGTTLLADLTRPGERAVIARGGRGGYGNTRFKTSTNQAPRRADPGTPGEERWLKLRLKLLADAGLIGLPNAGKSTWLARVSRARPKIADYPFTTLYPHLGVVSVGESSFVLADIPGLIEGAHDGAGLGDRFLGHIERCRVLVHLVDSSSGDVASAYATVRREIALYGAGLEAKPEIVVLNKIDAVAAEDREALRQRLGLACGREVLAASGASGEGVPAVLARILQRVAADAASAVDANGETGG